MPKTEISKSSQPPVTRPRDVFSAMRDEMDRVLGRFERDWPLPSFFGRSGRDWAREPELDVRENSNAIAIEVELPGVEEKDVTVMLAGGMLTITGEKKHERVEQDESYHLTERSFGAFQRSLRLPDTIDESKVEARFDKGVLKIMAPKKPDAIRTSRSIEIRRS
jgi:HSP20 family protein